MKPPDADGLRRAIGPRLEGMRVITTDLALYSTDIFYRSEFAPLAVVAPANVGDIQRLVHVARDLHLSLAVRGAGLSYSAGYIPTNDRTIVVDMTAMDRIVEINAEDRYVTVEAGVTWAALREALQPRGLTTPFWGTFSGRHATIGASLSQGAKFYGSGCRGTSAETTLGLKVVTGTGDVVKTGSAAGIHRASPFFRNYGPDLAGMFLGDCGAFGIKAEATLQLIPAPAASGFAAYSFDDPARLLRAMAAIGADALAGECGASDPQAARARLASAGLGADLRTLRKLARSGNSPLRGLLDAASVAFVGRRFATELGYMMLCVAEGRDNAEMRARRAAIGVIAHRHGGAEIPDSAARVMRAMPFPEMDGLLTPSGKRMNWLHTVMPNSRAGECFEATEAIYAQNQRAMQQFGIGRNYLLSANGPSGVGIETLIRWPDAAFPIHLRYLDAAKRERVRTGVANPAARAEVVRISQQIVSCWSAMGGVHLQIGRKYPYLATREAPTAGLLRELKRLIDPLNILAPGNLFEPLPQDGR